ncbi:MAG: DUF4142 domain-containing protein [Candidatus Eremiobacteraeota bacterium]|nr:DUF4142 domain-containing protein [Candidatus Eremiobacteraeota bacterium]
MRTPTIFQKSILRRGLPAAALVAFALATGSAGAQGMSKSASGMSHSASEGSSSLSSTDQQYLKKDAQGSVYDMTLAELGLLRGSNANTREYARMVVNDHTRLNIALIDLAHQHGMMDLPLTISSDDQSKLEHLMGMQGAEFDRAFAAEEVRINGQDVSDAEAELKATNSAPVRRAVDYFRATEARHLAAAKKLQGM